MWHKQKRWSSGWWYTDLWASCRTETTPYCDLLMDKHTNLCVRPLFLAKKYLYLSLAPCFSILLTLSTSWKCAVNPLLSASEQFLTLRLCLSLRVAFIIFFLSLFFPTTCLHTLSPSDFCSIQFWSKAKETRCVGNLGEWEEFRS